MQVSSCVTGHYQTGANDVNTNQLSLQIVNKAKNDLCRLLVFRLLCASSVKH